MDKKVLVLSNKSDAHTDSVIIKLRENGEQVIRLNTEDFRLNTIDFSSGSKGWSITTPEGRLVRAGDIGSIYVRRMAPVLVEDVDEDFRRFTINETSVFIDALSGLLPDVRWMDFPHKRKLADNKIYQLELAKQIGMSVPDTLVTNEYESLQRFMQGRQIVYKTLYIPVLDFGERGVSIINTTLLTEQHMEQLRASLSLCPSLFQAYVEKEYELRIHVIGGDVIAVAIDSQSESKAEIDWRIADFDTLDYKEITLPQDVMEKVRLFVKSLGLNFGIIDMIVTPDNQYIFLEINTNGNWLWIERNAGIEISSQIAEWLSCKTNSISLRGGET